MNRIRDVFGIDARCLGVFRMIVASLILLDLALRSRFIEANYTDGGVLPRELVRFPIRWLSVHTVRGDAAFQTACFAVGVAFAAMMLE